MYLSITAVTRSSRSADVPDVPEGARDSWLMAEPPATAAASPSAMTTTAIKRMEATPLVRNALRHVSWFRNDATCARGRERAWWCCVPIISSLQADSSRVLLERRFGPGRLAREHHIVDSQQFPCPSAQCVASVIFTTRRCRAAVG